MTKDEILTKLNLLKQVAENLDDPEKTFKLNDVAQLELYLLGLTLAEIAEKMREITLPDIEEMNAHIADALEATATQVERISSFNQAYDFIKGAIGFVI